MLLDLDLDLTYTLPPSLPSFLPPSLGFYHHWNLRAAEALHRPQPYISKQRHLNAKMRAILLDWVTDGKLKGGREGGREGGEEQATTFECQDAGYPIGLGHGR